MKNDRNEVRAIFVAQTSLEFYLSIILINRLSSTLLY